MKPANILLQGEPGEEILKLADFGLAKDNVSSFTATHSNVGTIFYQAPEVRNDKRYKKSADTYSCALIILQLFTPNADWIKWKKNLQGQLPGFDTPLPKKVQLSCGLLEIIDDMRSPKEDRPSLKSVRRAFKYAEIYDRDDYMSITRKSGEDCTRRRCFLDHLVMI